jgi:hypothetical protein
MRHGIVPCLALLAVSMGTLATAAEVESGLAVGKRAGAFQVRDVTGPSAGKSLCYR